MTKKSRRRRDGREVRQKGKARKRGRDWHRRHELIELPDTGTGGDPTAGAPRPIHARDHRGKKRYGGEVA